MNRLRIVRQAPVEDFNPWDEPIRRLGEYLERYPDVPESVEARDLLAKSFQQSAKLPRGKLKTAETENARLELRRTMDRLLNQGRLEFQQLQRQLLTHDESDRLPELECSGCRHALCAARSRTGRSP